MDEIIKRVCLNCTYVEPFRTRYLCTKGRRNHILGGTFIPEENVRQEDYCVAFDPRESIESRIANRSW